MDNSNLIVGLDIGTTSVKAVVANSGAEGMQVIGAVAEPTKGMRHGKIVDIDQTASSISTALSAVAQKINTKIYRVVTGIPVGMLQLKSARGMINISKDGREVNDSDVKHAIAVAIKSASSTNREAITFLPSKFLIDGQTDVDDPRKMIAHSLAVYGILLTAPATDLHNIRKAIERAGYQNNFFVPTPIAIASVALDEGERTFGSIILDIGGGTTSATVIHENKIKYATVDLEGGNDITKDISVVLGTSLRDAEQVKLDYGYADPQEATESDKFSVNVVGKNEQELVDELYLSQIIAARLDQILDRVGKGLQQHDAFKLPGGIVITGGTSLLQGIEKVVSNHFNAKARIFEPDQMGLRNPIYSASFGIVHYAYDLNDIDYLVNEVLYSDLASKPVQDAKKPLNNMKVFKTIASNDDSEGKVAYNNDRVVGAKGTSPKISNKKQDKKGIRDFFKKFFD